VVSARRAFLGLGSNVGDRVRYLGEAVDTLRAVDLRAVSRVYETEPVGGPGGQGAYLNLVAELETARTPHDLLGVCRRLEAAAGRLREERWGPRTLDVDVLWIDGVTVEEPDLKVPHPRMWERRFVLAPLRDLAPDLVDEARLDTAAGYVEPVGTLDELVRH
jgi:2-amino-4-hydroxy-6-hydroxymethyldihydropteridine diphosphokinase